MLDYIPNWADKTVGLTDKDKQTIIMVNNPIYASFIIHEFAHFLEFSTIIDGYTEIFRDEAEMLQAWTNTAQNNVSSSFEFVAESYKYYILDREGLKTHCPRICEYFDNL